MSDLINRYREQKEKLTKIFKIAESMHLDNKVKISVICELMSAMLALDESPPNLKAATYYIKQALYDLHDI